MKGCAQLVVVLLIGLGACQPDPSPVPFGGPSIAQRRLFRIDPFYVNEACRRYEGIDRGGFVDAIRVDLIIARDGAVESASVPGADISAHCKQLIADRVRTWRYVPFDEAGSRVRATIQEHVNVLPIVRWRTPRRQFPALHDVKAVQIQLSRWRGLAGCTTGQPSYRLTLTGSGRFSIVVYTTANPHGGVIARGAISEAKVVDLIERFRIADFYSMLSNYRSGYTDVPGTELSMDVNGERATVGEALGEAMGMPTVFLNLAQAVDRAVNSSQWVPPPRCYYPEGVR